MDFTISFCIVFSVLIILLIIIVIHLLKNPNQDLSSKEDLNGSEIFEYHVNEICPAVLVPAYKNRASCSPKIFNGVEFCRLNWKNMPDKYFSFYYILGNDYLDGSEYIYSFKNMWITIFDQEIQQVVGTLRYSIAYRDFSKDKNVQSNPGLNVKFAKSKISAASGILNKYQNANIIIDYRGEIRKIYIYTQKSSEPQEYTNFLKQQSSLTKK
uniref:Uncharacterized protein n=1 Tax=viral metagenome TaxID=1070528 RepID=A0A6C0K5W4_9ZZZZ